MSLNIPIPKERNLHLAQQVDQDSIKAISEKIIEITENDLFIEKFSELYGMTYKPQPIKIYIDSYGGQAYQCMGLLGIMKASRTPIHTIVTGCAMSCGFLIAIAGHKRFAYDKSTFLYHQVSSGVRGKLKDMQEDVEEAERLQKIIEEHTLSLTKLTPKQLEKNFKGKRDWFIPAPKALKWGIIDEIL